MLESDPETPLNDGRGLVSGAPYNYRTSHEIIKHSSIFEVHH